MASTLQGVRVSDSKQAREFYYFGALAGRHRDSRFKEAIIQAFYAGIKCKPQSTCGNLEADVITDREPTLQRGNFSRVIRESASDAGRQSIGPALVSPPPRYPGCTPVRSGRCAPMRTTVEDRRLD
jgi:hypothetical protein